VEIIDSLKKIKFYLLAVKEELQESGS